MSAEEEQGYLATINNLLADKNRLLHEKDELIRSKDEMWEDMHDTIEEKEEQIFELHAAYNFMAGDVTGASDGHGLQQIIQRLEEQNGILLSRVVDMDQLLRGALVGHAGGKDCENSTNDDLEANLRLEYEGRDGLKNSTTPKDSHAKENKEEPRYVARGGMSERRGLSGNSSTLPSQGRSVSSTSSGPTPITNSLPNGHTFLAMVGYSSDGYWQCGNITDIHAQVQDSIHATFDWISQRRDRDVQQGRKKSRLPSRQVKESRCLYHFAQRSSQCSWTLDNPRRSTCMT